MAGWTILVLAVLGFALVANATWPSRGPVALMPSWIAVFLTTDLAPLHIVLVALLAAFFGWLGAFDTVPGQLAALIMITSLIMLIRLWLPALRAAAAVDTVADRLDLVQVEKLPASLLANPFAKRRAGVEIERDIEFRRVAGRSLRLDVYRLRNGGQQRPAMIYLHGGGWIFGDKKDQGVPLCNHLAALGWVCFNVNYRLSPGATWPDHLDDAMAAIAWVGAHAEEFDVDPNSVALSGGSAGAHIAAMASLNADSASRIQAVVTSYGLYDLTNRLGVHNPEFLTRMVGPLVIKAFPDSELLKFSAASPIDNIDNVNIPWLVIHGDADPLAPVEEARDFFAALEKNSSALCGYAEIPGASHGFDAYYCHRAAAAVDLTARFFATVISSSKAV